MWPARGRCPATPMCRMKDGLVAEQQCLAGRRMTATRPAFQHREVPKLPALNPPSRGGCFLTRSLPEARGTGWGGDSPRATDRLRKEPGSVCVPQSQTETGPLSAHQAGRSTPWAGGARAQSRESVLLWRRPLSGWVRSAQTQVAPRRRPNDGAAQAVGVTPGRPSSCPGSATWKSYTLILVVSLTVH